jgi:hypothetical protein
MIARRWQVALGAAGTLAVAMPLLLLPPGPAPRRAAAPAPDRVVVRGLAPLTAAFERPLFAAAAAEAETLPEDAPALAGIVGRIDRDAVALVRAADGATRTLAIGESVDGWRLESLAIDAAFFSRGGQRVRVPLPAGE